MASSAGSDEEKTKIVARKSSKIKKFVKDQGTRSEEEIHGLKTWR